MSQATSPTRQQRANRAHQLRRRGYTWEQIAETWEADYPVVAPRIAFRWAHNLTHQDIAERWNTLDAGEPTMTKSRVYQFESWPNSSNGRRPTVNNLRVLTHLYQTTPRRLLTADEYVLYDEAARGEMESIDFRHLDENQRAMYRNADEFDLGAVLLKADIAISRVTRGAGAVAFPAIGLDELKRIIVALANASRYPDSAVADYFRQQLRECVEVDQMRGAKQTIPMVLGVIAAIEHVQGEATPVVRRDLLRVSAQAGEFAAWLYRDIAMSELANYWRDRAVEWAQAAGDFPMQGYVLLKKSQAAWDERDALRMLTLAQAVQEGPWRLPPRVRAEAAQQEARGHAMLRDDLGIIGPKLEEARALLAQDKHETGIADHYDEALFMLQVAICHCEAGQPRRAIELYDSWLSMRTFSRRDYGYFLSLKSGAYALAEEPDEASHCGLQALAFARETNSARTAQEIVRLVSMLSRWRERNAVRELREAMLT